MGDVAMTVPVLRAVTEQYPELKITVLTRAFFKPFFRDLKNVEVVSADVKGEHKGVFGLYKLARQLNKGNRFYAIADLHSVLRSKILKQFIRCSRFVSIDKGRGEKKALTSGKIFKQLKTTHQRYADVFETLGYKIDLSNPDFPKSQGLSDKIFRIVNRDSQRWVGVAPFAAHEGKMYPLDLMEKVIEKVSKKYKIILFGGGMQEVTLLDTIESNYENVYSVAGKLTLDEELNLISNLDVMLSMDSANAHIAAMLGIEVITIWGVTHPFAGFAPFNQPEDYALLSDRGKYPLIPTSVYGNKFPEHYKEVSRSIAPETVVKKVKSVVGANIESY
ncbi:glycosyltransferase family 9 protein [Algibacter sp. 2305UL17-15]|uniref:glycosyltransferase family 9 protein n=1 Tax=Algibacter sp. 2305UL17-15 TaxID=3231268 RepID=UPI0034591A16